MPDFDPSHLPPPLYSHPRWFYTVVALCVLGLTLRACSDCPGFFSRIG